MTALPSEISAYQTRTVELTSAGKALYVVLAVLLLLFLVAAFSRNPDGTERPALVRHLPLAIAVVVGAVFTADMRRTRGILERGTLTSGHVTLTYRGAHGPRIVYEYADSRGQRHQGSVRGRNTESFNKGQVIPVFYDPNEPRRSATPVQRFFRVTPST